MVAIREYRPASAEDAIDGACESRADGLHAAREGVPIDRLDEEMDVVRLQRVVHHAKRATLARLGDATLERPDETSGAE